MVFYLVHCCAGETFALHIELWKNFIHLFQDFPPRSSVCHDPFHTRCSLYCRNAWHLIQLRGYPPMAPWITHTSKIWRDTRTACTLTCHPTRAPRSWTQPEVPRGCRELVIWTYWRLRVESPKQASQGSWRLLAAGLLAASFWVGSASPRKPPSLLFRDQCKSDCSFTFVCTLVCFVCLFQEPGKLPEEEKLLTNCAAISFSNLECCQCRVRIQAQLSSDVICLQLLGLLWYLWMCVYAYVCGRERGWEEKDPWSRQVFMFCLFVL